ncbi:MAG: LysM peptidoglycan-binding domain-containing protein [Deltaproteobacteria bacterium]
MNRKLKYCGFLIVLLFLFILPYQGLASTYPTVDVTLNNCPISWDTKPVNADGNIYVPIAEMSQAVGLQGSFDIKSLAYSLSFSQNEIELKLDNDIAGINGKLVKMAGAMRVIDNRLMMPVKFLEQLGLMVIDKNGRVLVFKAENGQIIYKVSSGDFLWKISQMFGTPILEIKALNKLKSDSIYVGQMLIVKTAVPFSTNYDAVTGNATIKSGPGFGFSDVGYLASGSKVYVVGKQGLWYKVISPKGNGYIYYTVVKVTQDILDTTSQSTFFQNKISVDTSNDTVSYSVYNVSAGDTLWSISEKVGVPVQELASANGLTTSSYLRINQVLKVPVHTIGLKAVVDGNSGEMLDWFSEAQYIFPITKKAKVTDVQTGLSFNIQRTMGSSHSDTETLTTADTQTMKQVFGGVWSWTRRSFILEVEGRRFAVSIAGMPHSGVDGQPFLQNVYNRSDGYGYGPNYDRISGNKMDGHFDLYFLNGLRHKDNQIDPDHQKMVMLAGGLR